MLWLFAILGCIIQVSVIRSVAIFQTTPNVALILVIYIALFYGKKAMWVGFFTGLFIDLYSSSLGCNALAGTLVGGGIGSFANRVYREDPILWIITLFGSSLVYDIIIFTVQKEMSLFFFGRYMITGALYTTVVGLIIFYVSRKMIIKRS